MDDEFDTVAAWTADAALALGPDFAVPAGCRGSGSPPALDWLIERLRPGRDDRMLDCGAGVGGPAAYLAGRTGTVPVLTEPEPGACRAATRLFGLPVVQAATVLPFADATFDLAWSLGVLCTVPADEQARFLAELARVVRPGGRVALLVFVRQVDALSRRPDGNTFPDRDRLQELMDHAGLAVEEWRHDDVGEVPTDWTERVDAVDAELRHRHGGDRAWQVAEEQSSIMGYLLERGEIEGTLVTAHRPA